MLHPCLRAPGCHTHASVYQLPHRNHRPSRCAPPSSVQACGAGGCLRELRLRADSQLTVSPDALGPLCACLERLSLRAHSRSHESASTAIYAFGLEALSALKELELVGSAVELHRCHLPPRLTQLHLQGFRDLTSSMRHSLPRQASTGWGLQGRCQVHAAQGLAAAIEQPLGHPHQCMVARRASRRNCKLVCRPATPPCPCPFLPSAGSSVSAAGAAPCGHP